MDQKTLLKKIVKLESLCDQLQSEMNYLVNGEINSIEKGGIKTPKAAMFSLHYISSEILTKSI